MEMAKYLDRSSQIILYGYRYEFFIIIFFIFFTLLNYYPSSNIHITKRMNIFQTDSSKIKLYEGQQKKKSTTVSYNKISFSI